MKYIITILSVILILSCSTEEDKYSFIENFTSNEIGWVEESSDFHNFDIRNGAYYMTAFDTLYTQSSTSPMDLSFVLSLPEKFLIDSEIKYISGKEGLSCGIILDGASTYSMFSTTPEGKHYMSKYDYNYDKTISIDSMVSNERTFNTLKSVAKFMIIVSGNRMDFSVNGNYVGSILASSEKIHNFRYFVSPEMEVEVQYLRIRELSDEQYDIIFKNRRSKKNGLST